MGDENKAQDAHYVAEREIDITVERIADVYAEAFLGAAKNADCVDDMLESFDSLVSDVLDRFPELEKILASALISTEEKEGILDRVLRAESSPMFLNFLKVLSRHGRLDCLRAIHRQTHDLYDEMMGRVNVELVTPVPIDDALADRVVDSIKAIIGGVPVVSRSVDPELIGGAVLKVGDMVYDGSVVTQLQNVRKQMINRSVNEIQSRRDRFRYKEGN